MTPTEKCDRAMAIAQKRLARGDIKYAAYSAIVARAKSERDGKPAPKGPFTDMLERHRAQKAKKAITTKSPTPRAEATEPEYPAIPERKSTSAEIAAAVKGALAAQREGQQYLRELEEEERAASFAHRVEAARALAEGREPRADLVEGPEQPDHRPMDPVKFAAAVRRVQKITEAK